MTRPAAIASSARHSVDGHDQRFRRLRRWNLALTVLHLGQAIAILVLAGAFAITVTSTFPAGPLRNRAFAVYAAMSGVGAAVGYDNEDRRVREPVRVEERRHYEDRRHAPSRGTFCPPGQAKKGNC